MVQEAGGNSTFIIFISESILCNRGSYGLSTATQRDESGWSDPFYTGHCVNLCKYELISALHPILLVLISVQPSLQEM